MPDVTLTPDHAAELTELLEFLNAWLTSDYHPLNASLHQFVGHPAYDIERLKADLARLPSSSAATTTAPCSSLRQPHNPCQLRST